MLNIFLKLLIMRRLRLFLFFLGLIIIQKYFKNRSKRRPFECGFNPRCNRRLPFSLQFFLVAIIFVIFDVELILLFPFFIYSLKL